MFLDYVTHYITKELFTFWITYINVVKLKLIDELCCLLFKLLLSRKVTFCKSFFKPCPSWCVSEPPVETEYANDTEVSLSTSGTSQHPSCSWHLLVLRRTPLLLLQANGVCEEVREEDRRRASPPAEVFPVYASVKHTKPNRDDGTDEDSRAAAAASHRTVSFHCGWI